MNKLFSFFGGLILLAAVFAMLVLSALIYRANENSSVKSYIFQMNDWSNERLGILQNINDISANDLRNRLIKKYVSEYFKVIPGEIDVTKRPVLRMLSTPEAFSQWEQGEAQTILKMSEQKMFRMVTVDDTGIAVNSNENVQYDPSGNAEKIYYVIRYYMSTWAESNVMATEPVLEQGTLFMEARFSPGLREHDGFGNKINIRKYLEEGNNPVGLFKFTVTNIGDKMIK
ncbi:MAG: hypothetical protein IKP35_00055 [Alphaproteobacteria bacterium]|nr:hypothetical protein [Alphaproteobacteria bacterium]